jgi:hypothetical protein
MFSNKKEKENVEMLSKIQLEALKIAFPFFMSTPSVFFLPQNFSASKTHVLGKNK